jgi:hypothetical protein
LLFSSAEVSKAYVFRHSLSFEKHGSIGGNFACTHLVFIKPVAAAAIDKTGWAAFLYLKYTASLASSEIMLPEI